MRFHSIIEDLLASRIKVAVLSLLLRYPSKRFSGRELARFLGASPSSVLETLELLGHYGIVHKTRIGKTTEWIVNRQHLLAPKMLGILKINEECMEILVRKLRKAFSKNREVLKVVLFGSVVKGEEKPGSDIDLFVVAKRDSHKREVIAIVDGLNRTFISLFGNTVSAIVYSSAELKAKKESALVKHTEKEGKEIINRGS